jgi:hypothetical protein
VKDDHAQRMLEHLDNPIWFALTTEHRLLARSHGLAQRYQPEVSPLAALLHPTSDAFADLQRLVSPGEHVALFNHQSARCAQRLARRPLSVDRADDL